MNIMSINIAKNSTKILLNGIRKPKYFVVQSNLYCINMYKRLLATNWMRDSQLNVKCFQKRQFITVENFKAYASKFNPEHGTAFSLIGMGAILGFVAGIFTAGKSYSDKKEEAKKLKLKSDNVVSSYLLVEEPAEAIPTYSVCSPTDNSGLKITLYQYATCPFCFKVRTYLDYFGYSYDVIEVNSFSKKETKWSQYKKVPMMVVKSKSSSYEKNFQLTDSSLIISVLHSLGTNPGSSLEDILNYYPRNEISRNNLGREVKKPKTANKYNVLFNKDQEVTKELVRNIELEKRFRAWMDDQFVHLISPNIYRTYEETKQAFGNYEKILLEGKVFSPNEISVMISVGTVVMYLLGKRLKKKYIQKGVSERDALYKEANRFLQNRRGQVFFGGDKENLVDLNMYAVLAAIQGCTTFDDLMDNVPKMKKWYKAMHTRVTTHEGSKILMAQ